MRVRYALFAMLAAVLLVPADAAGADVLVVRGTHYELASDGPREEAEDWLRALDAAWPQFESFFGAAPKVAADARLRVSFHETERAWRDAIAAAGGTPPDGGGAGGYYDPVSKTAFGWRQPTRWYTRTLLLHEAAHQFHYLARTGNDSPGCGWYAEGVAEHLSHHTWDGTTLRLGVVPPVSLEDRPAKALAAVGSAGFDLAKFVSGEAGAPRPESLHLVRYLVDGNGGRHARKFHEFARKVDRGTKADADAFARAFGPAKTFLPAWRQWLPTVQEPWTCVFVEWEARAADALRAESKVVSLCRTRGPVHGVSAKIQPLTAGWKAGLLIEFTDAANFVVAMLDGGPRLKVERMRAGAWTRLGEHDVPAPADGSAWDLSAMRPGDGGVTLTVNGTPAGTYTLANGPLGLAVDHCTADFTALRAK